MMNFNTYIGMSYNVPGCLQTNPDDPYGTSQQKCELWEEYIADKYYRELFFTGVISTGIKGLEEKYLKYCNYLDDNYKLREKYGYETETKIGLPEDFLSFVRWTLEVYKDHEPFISNKLYSQKNDIPQILARVNKWISNKEIEIDKSNASKPHNSQRIKSFSWTGSDEQVKKLWSDLIDNGYIDPKEDSQAFAAIFGQELAGCKAIHWKASNRLLAYLFNQMYAMNLIAKEWQRTIEKYKLFLNRAGNFISAQDLASALSEINSKGLEPKGHEKVDVILKNIKTLRP